MEVLVSTKATSSDGGTSNGVDDASAKFYEDAVIFSMSSSMYPLEVANYALADWKLPY